MQLVVVDTTQIQPYIFGSNRLRENIGASHLVAAATEAWAKAAVRTATADSHNIGIGPSNLLDPTKHITAGLAAEVLYAGGGNFVALFDDAAARAFTCALSRRVLEDAPNLQLVFAQESLDWERESLVEKLNCVMRALDKEKRGRAWFNPLLGLAVTAMCQSTSMPANGVTKNIGNDPGYLASDEILAKIHVATKQDDRASDADARLLTFIPLTDGRYNYPADFEDLGGTLGEYSHIAVVHADGNGMGQRIKDIGERYKAPAENDSYAEPNRSYIEELRGFSDAVAAAAQTALQTVLADLLALIKERGGDCIVHEPHGHELVRIPLKLVPKDKHAGRQTDTGQVDQEPPLQWFLPFRPLVFGGDDLTFVCDGRLGISLAVAYLEAFERETSRPEAACGGRITASAGIAIVKSHYPFARAYALAGELTHAAKQYRKARGEGSYLDWHFALSGLGGSIEEIRAREYRVAAGELTLRPVTLGENKPESARAWPVVYAGIVAFQGPDWAARRNKIKALRDALRGGESAVEHFRTAFNRTPNNKEGLLPDVQSGLKSLREKGWVGGQKARELDGLPSDLKPLPRKGEVGDRCGYFDAIELVDWFVPLKGGSTDATAPTVESGA